MKAYQDKIAVITGGASGIGKCLGEKLAARGAHVVLSDINRAGLEKIVADLTARGWNVSGEVLDVSDYEAFQKHIDGIVAAHGRIDYIFNNAGIAIAAEFQDMSIEDWNKVIDINLHGVFHGSILAYKQMVKQGFGHIVNLSSIEGLVPFPTTGSYVATKYAVLGFTQGMWVEGRSLGVKTHAVCPGYIRTNIFDECKMVNIERAKILDQYKLLEKMGISAEKCADVILRGVAKDKPIIPVTTLAHLIWRMARLAPVGVLRWVRKDFDRWRHKIRPATP
ncbi:MAG: SDR family NAD(P)-dependent oxidoreductase [Desulfobacterales bacterium]|nr:SDR family NAD(P)-dependent oxidoreductase [Desulfobacterales bacterium]